MNFGLRGLSHGRFTGLILTRNVAETVLLSQIQKKLREDNIDVDSTADGLYKNMKAPDKVKEATAYLAPLVEEFFTCIKPWVQVKNYAAKNYEQDNQSTQQLQELEEEAAKYKQRLRSAGLQVTPKKALTTTGDSQEGITRPGRQPHRSVVVTARVAATAARPGSPTQAPPSSARRHQEARRTDA